MQQVGLEAENAHLRRLVAELLYLVSVQDSPDRDISNRRNALRGLRGIFQDYPDALIPHNEIYYIVQRQRTRAVVFLTGNFATQLLTMVNTRDATTGAFSQRDRLARLILDITASRRTMVASAGQEDLSDLMCHHDGPTAQNARRLAHALPDLSTMNVSVASMPHAAGAGDKNDDDFAGGLALSAGTSQDTPPTEADVIVAKFRAGNYSNLQEANRAEVVIAALSSSLAVMRSLLEKPAASCDTESSLETKIKEKDEDVKEAGAP